MYGSYIWILNGLKFFQWSGYPARTACQDAAKPKQGLFNGWCYIVRLIDAP